MPTKYLSIPLDELIEVPTRGMRSTERAGKIASLLTEKLNQMSEDGWCFVSSWKSASGTLFIFKSSATI